MGDYYDDAAPKRPPPPREPTVLSVCIPPDVGIFCSRCREFIQVFRIKDHRAAHKALSIFGYKRVAQVKSLEQLADRRAELQQAIRGHNGVNSPKDDVLELPQVRAPGRPRPSDTLDNLAVTKREYLLIDEAYQVIRDYCFFDKSPFILKPKSDVRHCIGLPALSPSILAVGIASDQNEAYRPIMEDFRMLVDPFGPPPLGSCLFGVFDGYNGTRAASFAAQSVPHVLLDELSKVDPSFTENYFAENEDCFTKETAEKVDILRLARDVTSNLLTAALQKAEIAREKIAGANRAAQEANTPGLSAEEIRINSLRRTLAKCLVRVDKDLAAVGDELALVRWSGCSGTIGLLLPQKCASQESQSILNMSAPNSNDLMLFVANCGNAHAIVIEGGKPRMLTEDHSVENQNEVQRIVDKGGKVIGAGTKKLICGLLSTTRGIGNYGQPEIRKAVTCSPCTCFRRLSGDAQMVIIATAGLWSVLSKTEVASIAMQTVTYCCAKGANSRQMLRMETASSTLLQFDLTLTSLGGENIQQHPENVPEEEPSEPVTKESDAAQKVLGLNGIVETVAEGEQEKDKDSYDDKGSNEESEENADNKTIVEEEEKTVVKEEEKQTEVDEAVEETEETSTTDIGNPDSGPKKRKKPWWTKNLSVDMPSASGDPFPGSLVLGPAERKAAKEAAKKTAPLQEARSMPKTEEMQPPSTMNSMLTQVYVEVARSVALNLASAALLAGSQENVTVQVFLLPNYRSLAEIHSRPLMPQVPPIVPEHE